MTPLSFSASDRSSETSETDRFVPPAVASKGKPRSFYRPELDALRFAAFISVFLCHALPFETRLQGGTSTAWKWLQIFREAGNFGVCLFFVLSSYLITELLRQELDRTQTVHLKAFYVRRSLRIWPLYFGVLIAAAVAGVFLTSAHMHLSQFAAYTFFVGNWYLIFTPGRANPLSWFWTISVEEQFYFIWPSLAKAGGMRAVKLGSILCLPFSLVAVWLVARYQGHADVTVWLNSAVQFQFFAFGALAALALAGRAPTLSSGKRWLLLLLGSCCWLSASGVFHVKSPQAVANPWGLCIGYELIAVGCLSFLLATLGLSVSRVPRFFIYLGKVSYGLYIFHELCLTAATLIRHHYESTSGVHTSGVSLLFVADRCFALLLTIGAAILSYETIEKPFLKLKSRFSFIQSRPV